MATRASRSLHIGLIPGDGIGLEVIPSAARILSALSTPFPHLSFTFTTLPAGYTHFQQTGIALPPTTLSTLRSECSAALFGAVSSPVTKTPGYSSPIVQLRKEMSLYANVRPVKGKMLNQQGKKVPVDMCIVRENTEDLYVKEERQFTEKVEGEDGSGGREMVVAEAVKRISERATRRIGGMAGRIALQRHAVRQKGLSSGSSAATGKDGNSLLQHQQQQQQQQHPQPKVTVTHKSNVLSLTDGLFRSTARQVLSSPPFSSTTTPSLSTSPSPSPTILLDDQIIDSLLYKLFLTPSLYDVILAPNLYGDLLSDAAAALIGSLGLVPSCNVGDSFVIGEPCHGSAPDIAGQGVANPIAAIRSAGGMLGFLGEEEAAGKVESVVEAWLAECEEKEEGRGGVKRTRDMGGRGTMREVEEEILRRL